mmetsp:Transcript_74495/g.231140  ORF Transcript_74495/g.231140 Transcript_74495/m.231140 type:complete len:241 (-) Transcript_74495:597-1319(-)
MAPSPLASNFSKARSRVVSSSRTLNFRSLDQSESSCTFAWNSWRLTVPSPSASSRRKASSARRAVAARVSPTRLAPSSQGAEATWSTICALISSMMLPTTSSRETLATRPPPRESAETKSRRPAARRQRPAGFTCPSSLAARRCLRTLPRSLPVKSVYCRSATATRRCSAGRPKPGAQREAERPLVRSSRSWNCGAEGPGSGRRAASLPRLPWLRRSSRTWRTTWKTLLPCRPRAGAAMV